MRYYNGLDLIGIHVGWSAYWTLAHVGLIDDFSDYDKWTSFKRAIQLDITTDRGSVSEGMTVLAGIQIKFRLKSIYHEQLETLT